MSVPILATKLFIPPHRPGNVPRPRLIERLQGSPADCRKMTLLSAGAGFGKTTLVSEWMAGCGQPVAWYSLDDADGDPSRFLTYLISALQTIQAGIGKGLLAGLQSAQPPQPEAVLVSLLNEISALSRSFFLVLDDYHSVESKAVDQILAFLVDHQPPQMHLVMITRQDPSLPLARMRARGQCVELRASDLRFTPLEAADFLNRVMGLGLSSEQINALETRTEGWIAGLQLAAISMQGLPDADGFIQSFTGSHRFVLDYMLEEVLQRQSPEIQKFLLQTSILDRLCGALCDAVCGNPPGSGEATLQAVERANLFIIPLDNERHWYRFHHLFCDLLRKRLGQTLSIEAIARLHGQASQWFEQNGLMLEAFRHAVTAQEVERAERLMEDKRMPVYSPGVAAEIIAWLQSLPDALKNATPALWWKQASLLLLSGQTDRVEAILLSTEAAIAAANQPGGELDEATRNLIGKIAVARATLAQTQAQIDVTLMQARRALEYLHPNNLPYRSTATRMVGFAHYWQGELEEAHRAYEEALSLARMAGDTPSAVLASIRLGQFQVDQNQIYLALDTFTHALNLLGEDLNSNAVVAYLGLSQIYYQWNDLETAEQFAEQSLKLARQYDQIVDRVIMSELHLGLVKLARKDFSAASECIDEAERISLQKGYLSRQANINYFRILISLQQGDISTADQIATQNDLPLMKARVLIAKGDPTAALVVLDPLRRQAEEKGVTGRILDVMIQQSAAHYLRGEKELAFELLSGMLAQGESQGLIRFFVDMGPVMAEMLSEAAARGLRPDYVKKVLSAFQAEAPERRPIGLQASQNLVEPLTPRELEILGLIAQGLSNAEICKRLFLALDTVKGHNRRIFEKLQVNRRTEAIARARALSLL